MPFPCTKKSPAFPYPPDKRHYLILDIVILVRLGRIHTGPIKLKTRRQPCFAQAHPMSSCHAIPHTAIGLHGMTDPDRVSDTIFTVSGGLRP